MKYVYISIVVLLVALFAGVEITGMFAYDEQITIGVVAPLSGSAAQFGEDIVNAVELAAYNTSYRIIVEDGKCDAKAANAAAVKLIEYDEIDYLIGGVCSPETLAAQPLATQNRIVQISPVSSAPEITDTPVIRLYPSDVYQAREGARILESIGASTVGVLYMNNDYGKAMIERFRDEWSGDLVVEAIEVGGTDYRTQLLKLHDADIDAVYIIGLYHETGVAARQMAELGFAVPIVSTESVKDEQLFAIAGEAPVQGLLFPAAVQENTSVYGDFAKEYERAYGKQPGIYAPYGYDSFMILDEAIQNTGGFYGEVIDYIKNNEFVLASGSIDIDENGDVVKPQQTFRAEGKEFVATEIS